MRAARRLVLLALACAVVAPACSRIPATDKDAIEAYTDAIAPHAKEGGRIVIQEIRPSLGDLTSREITGDQFRGRAEAWKRGMQAARKGFADAPAPGALADIAKVFDDAFAGYLTAIDEFVTASFKEGEALSAAISEAVKPAEAADKTYDRAIKMLAAERKRAGLPETSKL